jgi:serine protease
MTNTWRTITAIACALSVWLLPAEGQETAAPSIKHIIADLQGLGGIDRGLRMEERLRNYQLSVEGADLELPYVPGKVIVKWRSERERSVRELRREGYGEVQGVERPHSADFDVLRISRDADPEAMAERLAARDDVAYAQAAYRVYPRMTPNDPFYRLQWSFPAIDLERAWDINPGATSEVIVAVLDSGIAYRSGLLRFNARPFVLNGVFFSPLGIVDLPFAAAPDLGGSDRFVAPRDFIWDDDDPVDLDGHGTHVAGTIGQATNNQVGVAGVAFNVKLMPVKVIGSVWDQVFGATSGSDDIVARGVRYAADNGARVINMSIGRTGPAAPVIEDAVRYAVGRGAFVAIAAGNSFEDGNPIERVAQIAASVPGAVSVAAVGRDLQRARYSTTGGYVELAAPGGDRSRGGTEAQILQQTFDLDLVETYDLGPARFRAPRFDAFTYSYFQGTSMATPHVSGLAAMLYQQGITKPAAIEAALIKFAIDKGSPGRDDEYGHGLVTARDTLRGLGVAR